MSFKDWIVEYIRKNFGGNAAEFCRFAGINGTSIYAYMGGSTVPAERTMNKILRAVSGPIPDGVIEDYRRRRLENMEASGNHNKIETICWNCGNAVPDKKHGCSWSREFKPVDGWDAIPTRINFFCGQSDSFIVVSCPEFVEDEVKKQPVDMSADVCFDGAFEQMKKRLIEQGVLRDDCCDVNDISESSESVAKALDGNYERSYRQAHKDLKNKRAREAYWRKKGLPAPSKEEKEERKVANKRARRKRYAAKRKKKIEQQKEIDKLERLAMGDDYVEK